MQSHIVTVRRSAWSGTWCTGLTDRVGALKAHGAGYFADAAPSRRRRQQSKHLCSGGMPLAMAYSPSGAPVEAALHRQQASSGRCVGLAGPGRRLLGVAIDRSKGSLSAPWAAQQGLRGRFGPPSWLHLPGAQASTGQRPGEVLQPAHGC